MKARRRERRPRRTSPGKARDDAGHVDDPIRTTATLHLLLVVAHLTLRIAARFSVACTMADVVVPAEVTAEIAQILSNLVLGDNAIRQRRTSCPAL